ncbi:MAG: DUF1801 domain-containing protein [Paracoccaceae bacterium]|nr:DUF1801 domain-containing protein [Paracoccaceae bacterium]MDH5529306.1 DUF1801 domain-containing protein [Paracoccaceae bacterium]
MATNKTLPTDMRVEDYIATVQPAKRAAEADILNRLFRDVTGFQPVMWGASIIGYGRYHYRYASGREGDFLATGFSPRKAAISIYILPGYSDFGHILKDLGKHRLGKSCLYINKLDDIDLGVLGRLIRSGLQDLGKFWAVLPR